MTEEKKGLKYEVGCEKAKERGFWKGYGECEGVEVIVCPYRESNKVRWFWYGVGLGRQTRLKLEEGEKLSGRCLERVEGEGLGVVVEEKEEKSLEVPLQRSRRRLLGNQGC